MPTAGGVGGAMGRVIGCSLRGRRRGQQLGSSCCDTAISSENWLLSWLAIELWRKQDGTWNFGFPHHWASRGTAAV